jgi:hypothetical protein
VAGRIDLIKKGGIMQRLRTARWRRFAIPAFLVSFALALAGCDSGGPPPTESKAPNQAAKSSMEYTRKQFSASKTAPKTTGGHR